LRRFQFADCAEGRNPQIAPIAQIFSGSTHRFRAILFFKFGGLSKA
jgi:hypothetical protein